MKTTKKIFQIQILLKNITPKIWRRLLVDSDILLPDLHKIIQTSMGWTNSHLHQFIKDKRFYAQEREDDGFWSELDNVDYSAIRLNSLLKKEKDKIIYEYDFGDGWQHDVILEKILPTNMSAVRQRRGRKKVKRTFRSEII